MRPRFELRPPLSTEDVRVRLEQALDAPGAPCRGSLGDDRLELMTDAEHHFWSPELRARVLVDPDEPGACVLRGRFGPKPAVWTMFMVIYLHLAFIAAAALMYAGAQAMVGQSPWALWIAPGALALAGLVYLAARVGQRLGGDEMDRIARFVESALGVPASS